MEMEIKSGKPEKNSIYEETRVYAQKSQLKMMFKNSFSAKAAFAKILKMFSKKVPCLGHCKCIPVTVMKNNKILRAACIYYTWGRSKCAIYNH
jgi:hypothetical protein